MRLAYLMFMNRFLTKICDQVIALLSPAHTTSLVWGDEDRLYQYEVAKRNEQEESAALRPGFKVILSSIRLIIHADLIKMNSQHISHYLPSVDCPVPVDSPLFVPSLLHGETSQGFWIVTYPPQTIPLGNLAQYPLDKASLKQLL
jgi:hypothetical protein